MSELDCFIEVIEQELSNDAKKLLKKAKERHGRYHSLIGHALKAPGVPAPDFRHERNTLLPNFC